MIKPLRIKTLQEIQQEYPHFDPSIPNKELGYVPFMKHILGKPVTEWDPFTVDISRWFRLYNTWVKREMILFTKYKEPKTTVLFHDNLKITITIEEN